MQDPFDWAYDKSPAFAFCLLVGFMLAVFFGWRLLVGKTLESIVKRIKDAWK